MPKSWMSTHTRCIHPCTHSRPRRVLSTNIVRRPCLMQASVREGHRCRKLASPERLNTRGRSRTRWRQPDTGHPMQIHATVTLVAIGITETVPKRRRELPPWRGGSDSLGMHLAWASTGTKSPLLSSKCSTSSCLLYLTLTYDGEGATADGFIYEEEQTALGQHSNRRHDERDLVAPTQRLSVYRVKGDGRRRAIANGRRGER
ncbi:hypothetical protein DAEQUDRAFT_150048 [Daedalea quercina L-15889]|uniref:Uncharacterized protein n=1 Tax=Daedalea quercina L-15889 TaxID=1314783 RepID=A0A165KLT4_9APHY|nr:hypothetical protein DAEQUDRAFT_150048 [Daedalea quercina L-15889]